METNNAKSYKNFNYQKAFAVYTKPNIFYSSWQLVSTLVFYCILWYMMYLSLEVSYALSILFSIFAASMLVRLFVIMHDCGHGSFFRSVKLNRRIGYFIGVLLFIPFVYWMRDHAFHHGSLCNLDHCGRGDIWTLSVKDYRRIPLAKRLFYRLYRTPFVMFIMAPFFLKNRIFSSKMTPQDRRSIIEGNLWFIAFIVGMSVLVGPRAFFLVQVPIIFFASVFGVWFFYVQHQFDGAIWQRTDTWDRKTAALRSTSYYRIPKLVHWFSANIGFHNVHHLCPRIPNYYLEQCQNISGLKDIVPTLTFWDSLKAVNNRIWDEDSQRFVNFKRLI